MSASLVGSEMCIRDRQMRGRKNGGANKVPRRVRRIGTSSTRGGADLAVSYTHLTLPTICSV
eukprot:5968385-Alexandrium_andersonii.AAC.1